MLHLVPIAGIAMVVAVVWIIFVGPCEVLPNLIRDGRKGLLLGYVRSQVKN